MFGAITAKKEKKKQNNVDYLYEMKKKKPGVMLNERLHLKIALVEAKVLASV